jgi:uncharacterized protein (DUF1778 family)
MPVAQTARQRGERLEARVSADQKELIERAACVQGRTVTDFVINALQEAARKAIEDSTVWRLSQDQQKAFVEALMNPPAPNPNLRAARQRYQEYKELLGGR